MARNQWDLITKLSKLYRAREGEGGREGGREATYSNMSRLILEQVASDLARKWHEFPFITVQC